jgi:hypothetical protein
MTGPIFAGRTLQCHIAGVTLFCVLPGGLVVCSRCVKVLHCVKFCCAVLWLQAVVTTVARLYQQYSIELESGQVPLQVKQTFALVPAQGLRVRLHKR